MGARAGRWCRATWGIGTASAPSSIRDAFHALFGVDLALIQDVLVDAASVLPAHGMRLVHAVAEAPSDEERCRIIQAFLAAHATSLGASPWMRLRRMSVNIGLHVAGRLLGVGPRQVQRLARREGGMNVPGLSRLWRSERSLRKVREAIGRGDAVDWAAHAAEVGYADQSHLVRECKEVSGRTPAADRAAGPQRRGRLVLPLVDDVRAGAAPTRPFKKSRNPSAMNLPLPTPAMLLTFYLVGELFLMRSRLSSDGARAADRGSLRLLLVTIGASVGLAWLAARGFPQARFASLLGRDPTLPSPLYWTGLGVYAAGLALRWYSIAYLGRSFTFDVAVAADQPVIDTGPYRRIRHPAYTGALLVFVGLGLCGGNALSLAVLVAPIAWAFMRRIAIEEAALNATLGSRYADYAARTKRLIPFVY